MTVRNVKDRDGGLNADADPQLGHRDNSPEQKRHAVLVACNGSEDSATAALILDALNLTTVAEGMGPGVRGHRRGCQCSSCRTIRTRNKARARAALDPSIITHGTENGYQLYACRCAPCTTAHSDYTRGRYQALKEASA